MAKSAVMQITATWPFACTEIYIYAMASYAYGTELKTKKGEANFYLFSGKNMNLMDYCRSEKPAHKTAGQSIAYRCFHRCGDKVWTVWPKSGLGGGREGESGREQTRNKNLKQGRGRKKKSFYSNRGWKRLILFKTLHRRRTLWS